MRPIQQAVFGIPEYEIKRLEAYRPRISRHQMIMLQSKQAETGKPIIKLVAEAIDDYLLKPERGCEYEAFDQTIIETFF